MLIPQFCSLMTFFFASLEKFLMLISLFRMANMGTLCKVCINCWNRLTKLCSTSLWLFWVVWKLSYAQFNCASVKWCCLRPSSPLLHWRWWCWVPRSQWCTCAPPLQLSQPVVPVLTFALDKGLFIPAEVLQWTGGPQQRGMFTATVCCLGDYLQQRDSVDC